MKGVIRNRGKSYQVRYWDKTSKKEIVKSFYNYPDAELFLAHLNVSKHEGKLDARDYQKDNPMGLKAQAEKWLSIREKEVKSFRHLKNHINNAITVFGDRNIKEIGFGELEDFFISLPQGPKTKHNIRTTLHSFFTWFEKRERGRGYIMPDFPVINFQLGWRKVVTKETQNQIIEEVRRISWHINPRIWFGIQTLANFPRVRPEELRMVNEGDIDRETGEVWIRHTKEGKEKRIYLLDEDIEFIRAQPEAFGKLPFFRHMKSRKGIHRVYTTKTAGRFGPKYFYKWWRLACDNLGIEGVDLYGGTKHSTVTAAREQGMTPEEIKKYVTGHASNVSFDRYLIVDAERQREASAKIRGKKSCPSSDLVKSGKGSL